MRRALHNSDDPAAHVSRSVALWGWAGRRWGNERAFAIGCLIEAAGVALSVLGGGIWLILLAAGLLGGTFVGLTAIGLVEARHLSAGEPSAGPPGQ